VPPCCQLQLTHDGRWLTTTDNRNTVRVWDTSKLDAPAKEFKTNYPAEAASYCPAKNRCVRYLAVACLLFCLVAYPAEAARCCSCLLARFLSGWVVDSQGVQDDAPSRSSQLLPSKEQVGKVSFGLLACFTLGLSVDCAVCVVVAVCTHLWLTRSLCLALLLLLLLLPGLLLVARTCGCTCTTQTLALSWRLTRATTGQCTPSGEGVVLGSQPAAVHCMWLANCASRVSGCRLSTWQACWHMWFVELVATANKASAAAAAGLVLRARSTLQALRTAPSAFGRLIGWSHRLAWLTEQRRWQ
jgi:hypothetical protein